MGTEIKMPSVQFFAERTAILIYGMGCRDCPCAQKFRILQISAEVKAGSARSFREFLDGLKEMGWIIRLINEWKNSARQA